MLLYVAFNCCNLLAGALRGKNRTLSTKQDLCSSGEFFFLQIFRPAASSFFFFFLEILPPREPSRSFLVIIWQPHCINKFLIFFLFLFKIFLHHYCFCSQCWRSWSLCFSWSRKSRTLERILSVCGSYVSGCHGSGRVLTIFSFRGETSVSSMCCTLRFSNLTILNRLRSNSS